MDSKYDDLAREIWAEKTPEQRAEALKPVDWPAELARMEWEALQELKEGLAKLPTRSPFDFYAGKYRLDAGLAVSPAPAVPTGT